MPFPESPRIVFRRNPLAEVICQLRFPPLLTISARDPAAFQERIRGDYPYYRRQVGPVVPPEVSEVLGALKLPGAPELVRHSFATEDKAENAAQEVSLARDFLAVSDRAYTRWERFLAALENARQALEAEYRPAFYSRIGLRYVDLVHRSALGLGAEPWENLFRRELVGALVVPEVKEGVTEFTAAMVLRVSEVQGGLVRILHGLRADPATGQLDTYVVDVDIFTESRSEPADVIRTLDVFHRHAGNFFRWAITDRLRNALEPQPL
jgi:uncharacterized protein (TIGR04255 family)